jgi:hypothetical protein
MAVIVWDMALDLRRFTMATVHIPSQAEVLEYFTTLSNWGRWGNDDQLGTLNLFTAKKRAQAAALVHEGHYQTNAC